MSKLDEIAVDEWCEPSAYLEPWTGASNSKLCIGPFRLDFEVERTDLELLVHAIEKRPGAY